MKKTALILTVIMVAAIVATTLSACYVSRPADKSLIMGTYRLTSYTRTYPAAEEGAEPTTVDMIAEQGITAYLVIAEDGTGYYVYQDKDTALYARELSVTFVQDGADSADVREIRYTDGTYATGDGVPGKGHETLGVYYKPMRSRLTYTMPAVFGREYSQSVCYEMVSMRTNLAYVGKSLGVTLSAPPYALAQLDSVLCYDGVYDAGTPYIYYYVDYRPIEGKADVYYALKSDRTPHGLSDQTATYDIVLDSVPDATYVSGTLNVTIGTTTYSVPYYGSPVSSLTYRGDGYEMWLNASARGATDVEALITDAMTRYAASIDVQ